MDIKNIQAQRLREARGRKYPTAKAAIEAFGFVEPTYRSHENGGRGFDVEAAQRYGKAFGVNPIWLLGLGVEADDPELPGRGNGAQLGSIPIVGAVQGGNWREAVKRSAASMPRPDPSVPPEAFALRVTGDSMDELVEDGGTVIVDPQDKDLFPGRYYVVMNGDGETTFKRFMADPARLVPCSTNPVHKEIPIGSRFEIVGRVIWRASRM